MSKPITQSLINGTWFTPTGEPFESFDPQQETTLERYASCTAEDVDQALVAASEATPILKQKKPQQIATFINTIADNIETLGEVLFDTAQQETGLPLARLQGERGRTCNQLRAFANLVADGSWVQASIDTAQPERQPLAKPDIRCQLLPLGPVAVFGASNFPYAFGSVGGDTASALAAGNPVVVKGHPSHPGTSSLFAQAVLAAIEQCEFPLGTFALLQGNTPQLSQQLVAHPDITAVGFTGSEQVGRSLMDVAAQRPSPITVYAEMGSVNPVFLLPDALDQRAETIAEDLAVSITMGVGQFCTQPGLIVCLKKHGFSEPLSAALAKQPTGCMLNLGIANNFNAAMVQREALEGVEVLSSASDQARSSLSALKPKQHPSSALVVASFDTYMANPALSEEVFGPASVLIECDSLQQFEQIAACLPGNLTATLHTDEINDKSVQALLQQLSSTTGRILFNGYPTGVEVCASMQHGGSYPASSAPATTSVGTAAITRFTRRVAFQNCPDPLLPLALRNANPLNIWRHLDGEFSQQLINR